MSMISSPCASALKPYVKLKSCDGNPPMRQPGDRMVQACPSSPRPLPPGRQLAHDRETLCVVMCCCVNNPSLLPKAVADVVERRNQHCVADTLKRADKELGGQSRFKGEVTFDMTTDPPTPSRKWRNGAPLNEEDFSRMPQPYILGPDELASRRPDVVIVHDPTKAPYGDNIVRIIEMKFPGDSPGRLQLEDYQRIGADGNGVEIMHVEDCGCDDKKEIYESYLAQEDPSWHEKWSDAIKKIKKVPAPLILPPVRVPRFPPLTR